MVIALLLLGSNAFAQLNESDTSKFQLRLGTSGSWQKGNVEILVLKSRLELVSNGKKNFVFKSQSNNLYQRFGVKKADNDLNSRNFLYFKPTSKIYPFAMVFVQTNYRRKIDYRWFAGIGGTFQVIDKPLHNLKFSASLVKEQTRYSSSFFNESYYNGNEKIAPWRGTLYVAGTHKIIKEKIKLFYNANWQPALDNVPNHRVQMDIGAEMPIWKGLNFQIEYLLNYEQVVASNIRQIDRIFSFGINYQIKKVS